MRTVQAVAWKEIQIYFSSPTAYIVAMIFLALASFFFVKDLSNPFPQASMSSFFQGATIILILLAPTLTMRLLAEEQKLGTIELLLTSPVRDWEVVVGKYLASFVFLMGTMSLTVYYVLLLQKNVGAYIYASHQSQKAYPYSWHTCRTDQTDQPIKACGKECNCHHLQKTLHRSVTSPAVSVWSASNRSERRISIVGSCGE